MAQNGSPAFSDGATPGENDIVIALMGMTGSGKSSIISLCTNQEIKIGHGLVSCTQDVETYVFDHPTLRSGRVYLVDTPGFDDTNRKDTEILRTLSAWLTATYSSGIKLSGIIYCHRINQTRMQGSAMENIQLFRSLCGDDALSKVVLVTTMWDIENRDVAERREKELKETTKYWGNMIAKGSRVLRHDNTPQSASALVDTFVKDDSKIVLGLQKEMVNDQKPLDKTGAGQDIKSMLDEQHASLRTEIHTVESELREALRAKDEELAQVMAELRLEHQQALQQVLDSQQRLQATMQQLHESKSAELEAKLEEERQKWQSQIPPHPPNGVPDSSATNTSSPHLPGRAQIVHLFEREYSGRPSGNGRVSLTISPDGSYFAIYGSSTKLFATNTGEELEHYADSGIPVRFSPDGEFLAVWDGEFINKAMLDRSTGRRVRRWRGLSYFHDWVEISVDLETIVEILKGRPLLTSLATGKSHKLEWPTASPEEEAIPSRIFFFVKHDELLLFFGKRTFHVFETKNKSWLMALPLSSLADSGVPFTFTVSGDTLSFCVIAHSRAPSASGAKWLGSVSFFRLSGMRPELISTFEYKYTSGEPYAFLSFDGRYLGFPNAKDGRFDIVYTMSGQRVLSQKVEGGLLRFWFFPSDNRIMWMTKKGSYHVARLVDQG